MLIEKEYENSLPLRFRARTPRSLLAREIGAQLLMDIELKQASINGSYTLSFEELKQQNGDIIGLFGEWELRTAGLVRILGNLPVLFGITYSAKSENPYYLDSGKPIEHDPSYCGYLAVADIPPTVQSFFRSRLQVATKQIPNSALAYQHLPAQASVSDINAFYSTRLTASDGLVWYEGKNIAGYLITTPKIMIFPAEYLK